MAENISHTFFQPLSTNKTSCQLLTTFRLLKPAVNRTPYTCPQQQDRTFMLGFISYISSVAKKYEFKKKSEHKEISTLR